jgi:hypothetical protein
LNATHTWDAPIAAMLVTSAKFIVRCSQPELLPEALKPE